MSMPSAARTVTAEKLHRFCENVLGAAGLSAAHAVDVARSLVYADLCGVESHGVSRLPIYARRIAKGIVNGKARPHVLSPDGQALRVVDGDNAPGAVVATFAMREAMATAKETGVGFVLARHSNHFGVAAYYVGMAAEEGCVAICGTNAPPNMAVWGAREPALGTNPLAIAAPAGHYGQVNLDMSSSIVAKGKVLMHARKGIPVPEGWALDRDGKPTTDAAAAAAGVVLPFAGPKGSGLGLMIDLMAGVLSGAGYGDEVRDQYMDFDRPQNVGHFFIAVDVAKAMAGDAYTQRVEAFCGALKAKSRASGVEEILLPGENKRRQVVQRQAKGIAIDPTVGAELDRLASDFGCAPLPDGSTIVAERP